MSMIKFTGYTYIFLDEVNGSIVHTGTGKKTS